MVSRDDHKAAKDRARRHREILRELKRGNDSAELRGEQRRLMDEDAKYEAAVLNELGIDPDSIPPFRGP